MVVAGLLSVAFTAKASWLDGFIDNIVDLTKPKVDTTVIIQQNSIVATNQVEIQKSKYASKYLPTTQRKILPVDYDPRTAGQCVGWIKWVTGVSYEGNALWWKNYINLQTPEIDTIVVLQAGRWGHLGLVIDKDDTTITVRSRNWQGLWIVSDDKFDITDVRILGYIKF